LIALIAALIAVIAVILTHASLAERMQARSTLFALPAVMVVPQLAVDCG
jgi:hypothetical protein